MLVRMREFEPGGVRGRRKRSDRHSNLQVASARPLSSSSPHKTAGGPFLLLALHHSLRLSFSLFLALATISVPTGKSLAKLALHSRTARPRISPLVRSRRMMPGTAARPQQLYSWSQIAATCTLAPFPMSGHQTLCLVHIRSIARASFLPPSSSHSHAAFRLQRVARSSHLWMGNLCFQGGC